MKTCLWIIQGIEEAQLFDKNIPKLSRTDDPACKPLAFLNFYQEYSRLVFEGFVKWIHFKLEKHRHSFSQQVEVGLAFL